VDLFLLAEHPLFTATAAAYAAAFVFYVLAWKSARPFMGRIATASTVAAMGGNAALIVTRWLAADRPPFKSLFETMIFLALCIALVYLVMERLYATRAFGALATLGSAGALFFAIAKWDAELVTLPPALQSGWFIPHVVVYFFGYAALFFATVVSAMQLFKPNFRLRAGTVLRGEMLLEDVSYHSIRFGFVLLTAGLVVGAVWAKGAWGDYWVWDPKENWSLVTWLVYAAFLHLRHVKGWRGNRAAWLAIAGFAVVMFTYLGMEMLPTAAESAHVYQG
jgi:cytochrome c-type biogenesis protein CcsB